MSFILNFKNWSKLNESTDPKYKGYAQKIVGMLMSALGGADDEQKVLDALKLIPEYGGQPVYDNIIEIIKTSPNVKSQFGRNFNLVCKMITTGGIAEPGYDMDQAAPTSNPLKGLGLGITDEEWTGRYYNILIKYNPEEKYWSEAAHW
jgi:hypothetical protein